MNTIRRNSLKGTIYSFIGLIIGSINTTILFVNFLSAEEFGLTRVILSISAIISAFSSFGATQSSIRFYPYFVDDRQKGYFNFEGLLITLVSIGSFISIAIYLIAKPLIINEFSEKSALFIDYFYFCIPLFSFQAFYEFLSGYCRALKKSALPIFVYEVIPRALITGFLFIYHFDLVSFRIFMILFIGAYMAATALLLGFLMFKGFIRFTYNYRKIDLRTLKEILNFGMYSMLQIMGGIFINNIDAIMIGTMLGLKEVAIYSFGFYVAKVALIPSKSLIKAISAPIAESLKNNDQKRLERLYRQSSINQFFLGGLIFLLIMVNIKLLYNLIPGKYDDSFWVIVILGTGFLINLLNGSNGAIINLSKYYRFNFWLNIALIGLTYGSNLFFIPRHGLLGAAFATASSMIIIQILRTLKVYYHYKLAPFSSRSASTLILLIGGYFLISYIPILIIEGHSYVESTVNVIIRSLASFVLLLVWFKIYPPSLEIKESINKSLDRFLPFSFRI